MNSFKLSSQLSLIYLICGSLFYRILNNWFLTMASFADPRFLGLINPSLIPRIKDELQKSCDENEEGISGSSPRIVQIKSEISRSTPKKTGTYLNITNILKNLTSFKFFFLIINKLLFNQVFHHSFASTKPNRRKRRKIVSTLSSEATSTM